MHIFMSLIYRALPSNCFVFHFISELIFCCWNLDLMVSIKSLNWYFITNYILLNFSFKIWAVIFLTNFLALYKIVKRPLHGTVTSQYWFRQQIHVSYIFSLIVFFSRYLMDLMYLKTKNPGVELGTMGRPWHFASLADAASVKFLIAEACCLITVTEPYHIRRVLTL